MPHHRKESSVGDLLFCRGSKLLDHSRDIDYSVLSRMGCVHRTVESVRRFGSREMLAGSFLSKDALVLLNYLSAPLSGIPYPHF